MDEDHPPALGDEIGGGVWTVVADLTSLFMAHQLSLEFLEGDGFNPIGHTGHNRVKLLTKTHEDVGDDLVVVEFLAGRRHIVSQALHFGEEFRNGRGALGRCRERHPCGHDARPRLGSLKTLDRGPEISRRGR